MFLYRSFFDTTNNRGDNCMPQVYVILGPEAKASLDQKVHGAQMLCELGAFLINTVEISFAISGRNDVAFTAVSALATVQEAGVQIEIRYTAGTDEYDRGEPFDPTRDEQKRISERVKKVVDRWVQINKMDALCWTPSVWFKPYYNSHFEMA